MTSNPKPRLSADAEYILDLLVAAGHISREKAFQVRDIALEFAPNTSEEAHEQAHLDAILAGSALPLQHKD